MASGIPEAAVSFTHQEGRAMRLYFQVRKEEIQIQASILPPVGTTILVSSDITDSINTPFVVTEHVWDLAKGEEKDDLPEFVVTVKTEPPIAIGPLF